MTLSQYKQQYKRAATKATREKIFNKAMDRLSFNDRIKFTTYIEINNLNF